MGLKWWPFNFGGGGDPYELAFKAAFDANPVSTILDDDIFGVARSPYVETVDDAGLSGQSLKENIRDIVAAALASGTNISVVYDDPTDTITISYSGPPALTDTDDLPEGATNLYHTTERAQDAVGAMVGISLVYVDGTPLLARAALTGDVTAAENDNALTIANNAVNDAKLRDSVALSVIGRSANSSGDPADIAAASDGEVLRRSGTALGFGTVATAGLADNAVTNAKAADMATATIKGRQTAGTGDPEDLTAAQTRSVIGISTPASALLNMGMAFSTGNVADDAAASVALGNFNGGTMIIQANVTAGGMGLFFIRTNVTVSAEVVAQIGTTVNVVAGDGALTGTTGTDGKTNIRADSAAGLLWIENRTGATRGYTVYFFRQ